MGTLQAALDWARRGFRVFPLVENGKEPAFTGDWKEHCTSDPEVIRRMWTDPVLKTERHFNVGCECTDMVVVDLDIKDGKDGINRYISLYNQWDTLVVRTTSGGYHLYFAGPDSTNSPLAADIDIRSHGGYVAAPGSIVDGKRYEIVNDAPLNWVPYEIEKILERPYIRATAETSASLDSETSIQTAIAYLQSAAVAVEGQRGDDRTFQTAARLVREMALSPNTAFCLMRDYWNDRCQPPWDLDTLYQKVENAASYGSVTLGALTAEALYGDMPEIQPPPSVFVQAGVDWGNALASQQIPPRPWLVDKALMHGAVTMLLAAGSAGKSSVSLALAAHLALGKDFAGYKTRKPCKTIIYNGEDDVIEQSRRLLAVCIAYGFDFDTVKKSIMLLSSRVLKLDLVAKVYNQPQRNDAIVKHIIERAAPADVGLLILDPLVKIHKVDENNNVEMDYVMETLTDIADQANIAILALHHTTKGNSRQEDRIGNADIGRGGTAIINASRIAFTLLNASREDAEQYGLRDEERNVWVRLDDAKMNLALADDKATWFRKEGIIIPSRDAVGVLKHAHLEKSRDHMRIRIARLITDTMMAMGTGFLTMTQAVNIIREGESLWANKTDREIKGQVEGLFSTPVDMKGRVLHCKRGEDDKVIITMS